MLTIWTDKISHSTVGSSFSVTFSVAPNELEYLTKLYDYFNAMNMKSFPITADRKTEPQKWTKENCKGCKYKEYPYDSGTCFVRVCINGNKYEPKDEPQERSE